MRRACRAAVVVLAAALALSGCAFDGLNQFALPGTQGRGDGAYTVRIQLRDVTGVEPNSPVMVRDADVGTVTGLRVEGDHALVTVSLNRDVSLPGNARAMVGQTTVLGSKHIELGPAAGQPSVGRLADGDTIPLPRSGSFPQTEDVLASLSLLLNGGGLAQVRTITTELNATLSGRTTDLRGLLDQLNTFVGGLDAQKADIVSAIDGLDRLSTRLNARRDTLGKAIDQLDPTLRVLNDNRDQLVHTLDALGRFGDVAGDVVRDSHDDLVANLDNLEPTLRALADAGRALPDSLLLAGTVPFPLTTFRNAVQGDFANIRVTADLTLDTLDRGFLSGTPLEGTLSGLQGILNQMPGPAAQSGDPLLAPLQLPMMGPPEPVQGRAGR
ncbi:MAG TPA: MCE family protein [Pseudonocardia sp.]|uniref:MCE family protein n=1 Tax=Pseudonocardia sp. TaxID=60912 RepID=UPI002BC35909|nr:MCE family protein [Pseudonocardia sp.]HTF50846.1 MCE family protein [Pseudonocardia sp.]